MDIITGALQGLNSKTHCSIWNRPKRDFSSKDEPELQNFQSARWKDCLIVSLVADTIGMEDIEERRKDFERIANAN